MTQVCSPKVTRQELPDHGLLPGSKRRCSPKVRPALRDLTHLHASGMDDDIDFCVPCPRARRVLRVGHSIRAQVGNFLDESGDIFRCVAFRLGLPNARVADKPLRLAKRCARKCSIRFLITKILKRERNDRR